jgi:hypothetical protein
MTRPPNSPLNAESEHEKLHLTQNRFAEVVDGTSSEDKNKFAPYKASVSRIVDAGVPKVKDREDIPDFEGKVCFSFPGSTRTFTNSYRASTMLQGRLIENPCPGTSIARKRKQTRTQTPAMVMNTSSLK